MAEELNKNLSKNALNDEDLEQVTGGKGWFQKIFKKGGSRITATAGGRAAMEANIAANGKATIAEAKAAAVAYVNEN